MAERLAPGTTVLDIEAQRVGTLLYHHSPLWAVVDWHWGRVRYQAGVHPTQLLPVHGAGILPPRLADG